MTSLPITDGMNHADVISAVLSRLYDIADGDGENLVSQLVETADEHLAALSDEILRLRAELECIAQRDTGPAADVAREALEVVSKEYTRRREQAADLADENKRLREVLVNALYHGYEMHQTYRDRRIIKHQAHVTAFYDLAYRLGYSFPFVPSYLLAMWNIDQDTYFALPMVIATEPQPEDGEQ